MKVLLTMTALALASQPLAAAPGAQRAPQAAARNADEAAVRAVLSEYKAAIERLDATGTERLFATDSTIFETGGVEGSYADYLARHLGAELAAFKSFGFTDYAVTVRFEGPVALATETYNYRIEPKTGEGRRAARRRHQRAEEDRGPVEDPVDARLLAQTQGKLR